MQLFRTREEIEDYLSYHNLREKLFYFNIYGWDKYYTIGPTFATPTGKYAANKTFYNFKN